MAIPLAPDVDHVAAEFSGDGRYRYTLERGWDDGLPSAVFVMLNPSTADQHQDDPTVRKCQGYARRWGFGHLVVLNLFAFRSTDPRNLYRTPDPVGPENDRWITEWCHMRQPGIVVAAWGTHGVLRTRGAYVLGILDRLGVEVQRIGPTSNDGHPRHPLYLKNDLGLEVHRPARVA